MDEKESKPKEGGSSELDIYKFYDAIARIIGQRENVTIRFNIKKKDEE